MLIGFLCSVLPADIGAACEWQVVEPTHRDQCREGVENEMCKHVRALVVATPARDPTVSPQQWSAECLLSLYNAADGCKAIESWLFGKLSWLAARVLNKILAGDFVADALLAPHFP